MLLMNEFLPVIILQIYFLLRFHVQSTTEHHQELKQGG